MVLVHSTGNRSTTFSRFGFICDLEETVMACSDLLQSPSELLGKSGIDLLMQRHVAHNMFDELSAPKVIWDHELLQSPYSADDLLLQVSQPGEYLVDQDRKPNVELNINAQCKQVMWDEEMQNMDHHHGLLQELARGGEKFVGAEETKPICSIGDFFSCNHQRQVTWWDSELVLSEVMSMVSAHQEERLSQLLDSMDRLYVGLGSLDSTYQKMVAQLNLACEACTLDKQWAEVHSLDLVPNVLSSKDSGTHALDIGLNSRSTKFSIDLGMDRNIADHLFTGIPLEVRWDEERQSDIGTHDSMLQHLSLSVDDQKKHTVKLNASVMLAPVALGGECGDGEKMICIPPIPGNTWSDPFSDFESVRLYMTAHLDNIQVILTEVDDVKHELGASNCQVSECEPVFLEISQDTIDDCTSFMCPEVMQQLVEHALRDRQHFARQMEATDQPMTKITLNHSHSDDEDSVNLAALVTHGDPSSHQHCPPPIPGRNTRDQCGPPHRHALPKMSFAKFAGTNPKISKAKCVDYFDIFQIPATMWVIAVALHMESKSAQWLQVYKLHHHLGTWGEFTTAIQRKFGADDYHEAMESLLSSLSIKPLCIIVPWMINYLSPNSLMD